jgi:type IV pilus assembly protein PilY1
VISGTTEDGTYLMVRDLDTNSSGANYTATVYAMPTSWSHTFTPLTTGSTTQFLHDPLWYAAKYGGFNDQNNDNLPDTQDEWDQDNKGDPDTYFLISNPLNMEKQLTAVFEDILKKSASGTSVSILETSAEGEGALYQAYFYPEKPNPSDNTRKHWLGYVRGLFLDSYGNLREDTNQDSRLVFHDDLVLRMKLDPVTNQVTADLFSATAEDGTLDSSPTGSPPPTPDRTVAVDDIKALWEAGTMLAKRDKSTRNLYVWVDQNKDGTRLGHERRGLFDADHGCGTQGGL